MAGGLAIAKLTKFRLHRPGIPAYDAFMVRLCLLSLSLSLALTGATARAWHAGGQLGCYAGCPNSGACVTACFFAGSPPGCVEACYLAAAECVYACDSLKTHEGWSDATQISSAGTVNFNPSLVADAFGDVHAFWQEAGPLLAAPVTVHHRRIEEDGSLGPDDVVLTLATPFSSWGALVVAASDAGHLYAAKHLAPEIVVLKMTPDGVVLWAEAVPVPFDFRIEPYGATFGLLVDPLDVAYVLPGARAPASDVPFAILGPDGGPADFGEWIPPDPHVFAGDAPLHFFEVNDAGDLGVVYFAQTRSSSGRLRIATVLAPPQGPATVIHSTLSLPGLVVTPHAARDTAGTVQVVFNTRFVGLTQLWNGASVRSVSSAFVPLLAEHLGFAVPLMFFFPTLLSSDDRTLIYFGDSVGVARFGVYEMAADGTPLAVADLAIHGGYVAPASHDRLAVDARGRLLGIYGDATGATITGQFPHHIFIRQREGTAAGCGDGECSFAEGETPESCPSGTCPEDCPDSDGDGLPDPWETDGVDIDGDGDIDLDLASLGANPAVPDIFVEVDYVTGAGHSHALKAGAQAILEDAFAAHGIALHIDVDDSTSVPDDTCIILADGLGTTLEVDCTCEGLPAVCDNFYGVKSSSFDTSRIPAFHYAVMGHSFGSSKSGVTGRADFAPGNDFVVTLGGVQDASGDFDGDGTDDAFVGTTLQQAGAFMHEIGHNLKLFHGGGDIIHHKPNYLSVMNYRFMLGGIPPTNRIDYSCGALPLLDEANLDEVAGVTEAGVGLCSSLDYTVYSCGTTPILADAAAIGPIDWDCDGVDFEDGVVEDITGEAVDPIEELQGFDDWASLELCFQTSSGFADGVVSDEPGLVNELSADQARADGTHLPRRFVRIEVRPGGVPPRINLNSNGLLPVVIFGAPDFDVATIDSSTLVLAGASPHHTNSHDEDHDGVTDVVAFFRISDLVLSDESTTVFLLGRTAPHGQVISGRADVDTFVP